VTVPRNIAGLEDVTLKGGIWPNWLARMGIAMERVGAIRGEGSQRFWADLFYKVLPRLPKGKCTVSGFHVDVWGELGTGESHAWYTCVDRMNRITSIPAALGAVMVAQGEIGERGVFSPEAVLDPDVMFSRLEPYGVRVERHEP
jgi:saccharopine dehydrogenase-like NADP-dependent oxidoreductase